MDILEKHFTSPYIRYSVTIDDVEVGWVFLFLIQNDRHKEPYGLLENLYVDQDFRGCGVARLLIRKVIDEAKKYNCYKLLTQSRHSKEYLHGVYERYGFFEHGKNFRMNFIDSIPQQKD